MENILEIKKLNKAYPDFALKDVSFSLPRGYIMGFVGENGSGKTTTIRSILDMAKIDSGKISVFGLDSVSDSVAIKQRLGVVFDSLYLAEHLSVNQIEKQLMPFYAAWDTKVFHSRIKQFGLPEDKAVGTFSKGMKMKLMIAVALSHDAELMILDEPTSGLDPVSRDDLLNVFRSVVEDGKRSILFSTHIISDLEKCADFITYIKNGSLVLSTDVESFKQSFRLISGSKHELEGYRHMLLGYKENAFGFTGLIRAEDLENCPNTKNAPADLESIMIYYEKENNNEKAAL